MARLGELLTHAGIVSADKVDQALRAQVVWGGRLGTNLIELGCIDLDELSRQLGAQHAIPAALARHFDKSDAALQALLPAAIAKQFSVVPLVRLSPERIAVVALDPLEPAGLHALAEVYGVDPLTGVVVSVAAEMRVLYHLERVYKIPRSTRYLRSKKAGATMEFPAFDNVPVEVDSDSDIAIPIEIDQTSHPTSRVERGSIPPGFGSADEVAALIDSAIDAAMTPPPAPGEPQGRERRTYVRTLKDQVEEITGDEKTLPVMRAVAVAPTAPVPHVDALPSAASVVNAAAPALATSPAPPAGALGRIAIRRVAVGGSGPAVPPPPPVEKPGGPANLPEAIRYIKRGTNRDRVADLAIETVDKFVPSCDAAMLLVIRGDLAIGWKHFCRTDGGTTEIAVPLDEPGIVPTVIERKVPSRCHATELDPIDARLLRAVGGDDGDLVVVPITIGDQVMCLLAAATVADSEVAPLESVASAASAAFARLIRAASR